MKLAAPLLGTAVAAAVAGAVLWHLPVLAQTPDVGTPAALAPADARTEAIVAAANAFLATLSDGQRQSVTFDWADRTQRANWSNFPNGGTGVARAGIPWGDLDETQRQALLDLLTAVMGEPGMTMARQQMAADDVVASGNDGNGRGGQVSFGSPWYFVTFLGQPSTTAPWMLQFGGHHLAINATIAGPDVTLAPSLTGGEPLRIDFDGAPVTIAMGEVTAAAGLWEALDETQQSQALLSSDLGQLLLGPGEDGRIVDPEGLPARAMTEPQKQLLRAVIEARLSSLLNEDDLAATLATIEATLDDTHFAWSGPTDVPGAGYFRITGPRVVIEYAPQSMDGDPTDHAHNIYRDPANDYGTAWVGAE